MESTVSMCSGHVTSDICGGPMSTKHLYGLGGSRHAGGRFVVVCTISVSLFLLFPT
uniref:Uncharacterized protein n=1 Tax=Anopheles dirus TaxID=7168 RepID=A0A182NW37_9DIPT